VNSYERTVYRTRTAVIASAGCAFVAPLAISAPAFVRLLRSNDVTSAVIPLFFVISGILLCGVGIRCATCALRVVSDGVEVINPMSRTRLSWGDIERFELGRWGLLPRNGIVRMKGGGSLGIWAISARNPVFVRHDADAEGMIGELNELLNT